MTSKLFVIAKFLGEYPVLLRVSFTPTQVSVPEPLFIPRNTLGMISTGQEEDQSLPANFQPVSFAAYHNDVDVRLSLQLFSQF